MGFQAYMLKHGSDAIVSKSFQKNRVRQEDAIIVMKAKAKAAIKSPIRELSKLISSRELSCEDLIDATLERIEKLNPILNGFITVLGQTAKEEARKADSLIRSGRYIGPLHGIPISLKDLIYVRGVRSTSGSKILSDFVPDYDATVVTKLREAGAIIIGTNNTHEFACGITNINPHFGSSRNPWDSERISGGSSGGSGVAERRNGGWSHWHGYKRFNQSSIFTMWYIWP